MEDIFIPVDYVSPVSLEIGEIYTKVTGSSSGERDGCSSGEYKPNPDNESD